MKSHTINPADIGGDYNKQIAGQFDQRISKEIVIRTHITTEGKIFTFLEVYDHRKMVYSGGDLPEAIQVYNEI